MSSTSKRKVDEASASDAPKEDYLPPKVWKWIVDEGSNKWYEQ
jgi:hypothetical protein